MTKRELISAMLGMPKDAEMMFMAGPTSPAVTVVGLGWFNDELDAPGMVIMWCDAPKEHNTKLLQWRDNE